MPILSRNVDRKSLETEFSIAIWRHTGDKWQSKISISDLCLLIVDSLFDCRLPGVINTCLYFLTIHMLCHELFACPLLITFVNSLNPDQAQQYVRPDLDQNCLTF